MIAGNPQVYSSAIDDDVAFALLDLSVLSIDTPSRCSIPSLSLSVPQNLSTMDGWFPRPLRERVAWLCVLMLSELLTAGCNGRAIKEDNPVFTAAPPRRSLTNQAADIAERRLAEERTADSDGIIPTGYSSSDRVRLTGTTVVAEVNGKPVFVDDVLGGGRKIVENDQRLTDDQRQQLLRDALQKRLTQHCEDELVLQALEQKIPEDKRELLKESLEPAFQKWLDGIRQEKGIATEEQLEQLFAQEGMTKEQMRQTFMRIQMINGYLASLDKTPSTVDREDLVKYYQEHIADYTPDEQVRYSEIVVRFRDHGGRDGAEQVMTTVVTQLQNQEDFGKVAAALSDTLTAEKQGDVGWIKRGSLSDKELEAMLFDLPVGTITRVQVREDRFEVYKVVDHRKPETQSFQEVQKDIEQTLLAERRQESREQIRRDIRSRGTVVTMFDRK